MLALKRLVTILVMVYVLLALLLILSPGSRDGLMAVTAGTNAVGFYYALFVAGAVLLTLQLVTENLDSTLLRRDVAAREGKINELKARLYDHQLEQRDRANAPGAPRTGTTTYPEPPAPVFPQPDPGLSNAPITRPNSIIPPDATERPTR